LKYLRALAVGLICVGMWGGVAVAAHHSHSADATVGSCHWDGRNFHLDPSLWGNTRDISGGGPGCGALEVKVTASGGTSTNSTSGDFVQTSRPWSATHHSDHNAVTPNGKLGFRIH